MGFFSENGSYDKHPAVSFKQSKSVVGVVKKIGKPFQGKDMKGAPLLGIPGRSMSTQKTRGVGRAASDAQTIGGMPFARVVTVIQLMDATRAPEL